MEEIERRFLCRLSSSFEPDRVEEIEQGYLAGGELQVRIRRRDEAYILGAKHGAGLRRMEREIPVSERVGRELLEQAGDWSLRKERRRAGRWEVDVYRGKLEGLAIAECELEGPEESLPEPPEGLYLEEEVTESLELTAQQLARLSAEECRSLLEGLSR